MPRYLKQAPIDGETYLFKDAKAWANTADAYSASSIYQVGDLCLYDGDLYRCITAIATSETWNSSHWTQTTIEAELESISSSQMTYYTGNPAMNGTASAGSAAGVSRGDHVHPSDTTRVPTSRKVNGKALSSDITLDYSDVGAAATNHGTHVTYSTTTPAMNGTASAGSADTVARSDHVHPSDTSRVPTSRTVNGKALSANITLASSDIGIECVTGTATVAGWSGTSAPYTQTITVSGVTSSNNIMVGAGALTSASQVDAYIAAQIVCSAQGANSITLKAYGDKPTVALPVSVVILG